MHIDLTGRSAIVTGGSKGLGLAIARRFVESGAKAAIVARGAEALAAAQAGFDRDAPGKVLSIAADVATTEGIGEAFDRASRAFGAVDIVVNNAGVSRAMPFMDATDAVWQADFDLKLFAAIRLSRLAWPGMQQRRWGRIVNVLNIGAKTPGAKSAPTSITRAAGMALTKVLSAEGAPHNILVNALLVGLFATDQWERGAKAVGQPLDDFLREKAARVPLGRIGEPEEFAAMACFLASDQASYITGTAINMDGGLSPVV